MANGSTPLRLCMLLVLMACSILVMGQAESQSVAGGSNAAAPTQLPVKSFAMEPELSNLTLSPNGKYLAAALNGNQSAGSDAKYQLVVFALPSLKITARLNFAPYRLPGSILWVSPTRLVVSESRQSGTFDVPSPDGNILTLDYDGKHQRTLYSVTGRGELGNSFNMESMVSGFPNVAGATHEMNGHVFISISPTPMNLSENDLEARRTVLYDVNSMNGYPKKVAEIDRGNMTFVIHDDQPVMAYGDNDELREVVYLWRNGQWQQAPKGAFGERFEPLEVTQDGRHVYALYSADGGPKQLIKCQLDGSGKHVLASNSFGSVNRVLWTPGKYGKPFAATYTATFANGRPAVTYLRDDRWAEIHQALMKEFPSEFVQFAGMSLRGATILVFAYSNSDPGELALLDTQAMHLKPLLQLEPWFKPGELAAREPIRFKDRNGVEMDGYLTLPVGATPKDLPMVLLPHGGPIGPRDSWAYLSDPQQLAGFLANRGYAVLQVNYRGSGGRGRNYQHAGYRQFGTGIQDDLIDGVKWAIAQGYADPQRICVFGGSFGGYSALMQPILASSLYKCAIDYAGVYDWRINFDRSDTSHVRYGRNYFKMAVGDRAQAYAISPASMIAKFNVPVLIAQGGEDPRVPPQNAEDLRSALRAANKPYEWVWFDKEGHGFTLEPHREALLKEVQVFLTEYLGPGVTATGASRP